MSSSKITAEEWNLTCAVEEFWHSEKHFPGTKVLAELTDYSEDMVRELLESERLIKRFTALGIDYNAVPIAKKGELKKNESRLTDKQLAVAMTVLNVADQRPLSVKLKTLGVAPATYHGWTKNHLFSDFMQKQAEEMFGDAMPLAHRALLSKVMQGDVRAIKLYYEMTGRWNGQQSQDTQNFKMLVIRLVEIIQKHVSDPMLMQVIADEIKSLINPAPPPVAIGQVIHDSNTTIRS